MRPCRTATVARASSRARWFGVTGEPKSRASVPSRRLGTSLFSVRRRARTTVSTTGGRGQRVSVSSQAWRRKPMSKPALWATSVAPCANSRNAGRTDSMPGASATISSVMPVRRVTRGSMDSPGLTREPNSPMTWPPLTLTAPISVIPQASAARPVVSRSTTQNVTSDSGVPRLSRAGWV